MKWFQRLYRLLRIMVLCSLLLLLGTYVLLGSETGTRWLLNTVFKQVGSIRVAQINGTLLNQLALTGLHYTIDEASNLHIQKVHLSWQALALLDSHLHIEQIRLDQITLNGTPLATEEASNDGSLPVLPVKITLDDLYIQQFRWIQPDATQQLNELRLSGQIAGSVIQLHTFNLQHDQIKIQGQAQSNWHPDWPFQARLNWSLPSSELPLHGILTVDGNIQGLQFNSDLSGAIQAHQSGQINWSQPELAIHLQGDWQQLQWPLTGVPQIESRQGTLQLIGSPEDYQFNLTGQLAIPEQPIADLHLQASGSADQIHLSALTLKSQRSTLNLQGDIGWQPELSFNLQTHTDSFFTDDFISDIPGVLSLKAQAQGKMQEGHLQGQLQIEQLQGHLFQQKVAAQGRLNWDGQTLQIAPLKISAGRNHLNAEGYYAEQKGDLSLNIQAADLSTAWPTLKGQLQGNIHIQGTIKQPQLQAKLDGHHLQFAEYSIKTLHLNANYPGVTHQPEAKLVVEIKDALLNQQSLDVFELQGRGDVSDHHFRAHLKTPQVSLNLAGQGQALNSSWTGTLNTLALMPTDQPAWQLEKPVSLQVQTRNDQVLLNVSQSCLQQSTARFCFNVQGNLDDNLQGQAQLSDWSLAQLKPWLPDPVSLKGRAHLNLDWRYRRPETDLNLQLNAWIDEGRAIFDDEGHQHQLSLYHPALQLKISDSNWQGHLNLGLNDTDRFLLIFKADPENNMGERPLSGTLQAHLEDLTVIDGFIPAIHDLQGSWQGDFQLAGTLQNPKISGQFEGDNGRFFVPAAGIQIEALQWKIHPKPNHAEQLEIFAQMQSGQGLLKITGDLTLSSALRFPLGLHIEGRDFQVSRLPEAEVTLSPDLTLHKQGALTSIKGKIEVAKAQIELQSLPENITPLSEDEVIINPDATQTDPPKVPENVEAQVDILFGEQIRFKGLGLQTRLAGKLKYRIDEDRQILQGRAMMKEASYRSYGQDLNIRRGEFLFNGPATNPWMNIEAIRESKKDNVTAILNVSGPLDSPTTRIYSEPELSESEALSYLITGNSLHKLSQGESASLANAALSYGVGQLSWLGDQLGIDELDIESGDTLENSAIRLGQYLNPDLYVGISMGLFTNKYAARLNYRLTPNISVGTRAGETQRIDLNYHFATD